MEAGFSMPSNIHGHDIKDDQYLNTPFPRELALDEYPIISG